MQNVTHLLAVDGGGSGCRVALADPDGQILARATGGPANMSSDPDAALRNLRDAVHAVLAGLPQSGVVAHMGLAGVLNAGMGTAVAQAFDFAVCTVSDDRATTLAGALGDLDGVLLALGTGSIMAGQFGGALRFVSGWGFQVSDQASGAWLGRALLQRVLLCHDGLCPDSPLSRAVLRDMGGPIGIVRFVAGATAAEYAALAPRVVQAEGDRTAAAVMTDGVEFLERALGVLDPGGKGVICLVGGVGPQYARWMAPQHRARLVTPLGTALDGALTLARRAATGDTG